MLYVCTCMRVCVCAAFLGFNFTLLFWPKMHMYAHVGTRVCRRVRRAYTCNELRRKARDHRAGRPVNRGRGAIGVISDRCFSCSPPSEYGRRKRKRKKELYPFMCMRYIYIIQGSYINQINRNFRLSVVQRWSRNSRWNFTMLQRFRCIADFFINTWSAQWAGRRSNLMCTCMCVIIEYCSFARDSCGDSRLNNGS